MERLDVGLCAPDLAEQIAAQWGKGPRVFRNVLREPVFTARELMSAVAGTAMDYLADPTNPSGRVFIGGKSIAAEQLPPFLPTTGDESFDAYVAQIRRAYPTEEFAIVLDGCEKHVPAAREKVTPLLHSLFGHVGYPARWIHACIYAGNYKTTPFGIHRDDCHVLMFSGFGTKKMAFWRRSQFDDRHDLFIDDTLQAKVSDYIGAATVLEIDPLDVLYWPAADWHVGVSDGDVFHAALSVGLYHRGSNAEKFMAMEFLPEPVPRRSKMKSVVQAFDTLGLHGIPLTSNGRLSLEEIAASPMGEFFTQWERVREALNKPGEVERRALDMVMRTMSSAGFGPPRTPSPAANAVLAPVTLRCFVPQALIVASSPDGLMVGANGVVLTYTEHLDAIEKVVAELRTGAPRRFDAIMAAQDVAARATIEGLIRDLLKARAVKITDPPPRPA